MAHGSTGREGPGKAYRLYTEASFNQLPPTSLPEIQRVNLATVALQLKALGFDDLLGFDFMDKPPKAALLRALELLYSLGALNDAGQLTCLQDQEAMRCSVALCKSNLCICMLSGSSSPELTTPC